MTRPRRFAVVTPTFPPIHCGVGDYSANLSQALAQRHEVTVFTTTKPALCRAGNAVLAPSFDGSDPRSTLRLVPKITLSSPDYVVVQYDPYSYGARYAFNPYLPWVVAQLRRRLPHSRIAVVVHETAVAPTSLKRAIMTSWQRAQLFSLGRAANVVVFPVARWVNRFSRWFPRTHCVHIPVGNNIPISARVADLRAKLGISPTAFVVGCFGRSASGGGLARIAAAAAGVRRAGRSPLIVHIGVGAEAFARPPEGTTHKVLGSLSPVEISRSLQIMDVCVTPFPDGISGRRTSALAALAHGVPVIAPAGLDTDDTFLAGDGRSMLLVHRDEPTHYEEAAHRLASSGDFREQLGRHALELVERSFSWRVISDGFLHALESAGAARRVENEGDAKSWRTFGN